MFFISVYKKQSKKNKYFIGDHILTNTSPADIEPATFKVGSGFTNMMVLENGDGGMDIDAETGENRYEKPISSRL